MTEPTHPLVARAAERAPALAALTPLHEAERRLAPAAVAILRDDGFLSALLPAQLGGHALSPVTYVELLAELAAGDAASAWCTMTASTSTLLAAYMERDAASQIWRGGPTPFMAGVFAPSGKIVVQADGSARLAGRWAYGSGSRHADHFALGALVDGQRRHVICIVDARDVQIVDNWDTLGLAGTGSHDVVVEDAAVPAARLVTVFGRAPWPEAPLYRVPLFGVLALGVAACALGVAEAALAEAGRHLAPAGKPEPPPSSVLADFARQHAAIAAARAYLLATARRAEAAAGGGPVGDAVRGELRLAAVEVAARCGEVVRAAFHLGGGASIRTGSRLGRALRDVETILTHRMVAARVVPAAARAILNIGTAPPDL